MGEGGRRETLSGAYRSYFCAVLLLVLGALAYLWGHTITAGQMKELDDLRHQRQASIRRQERLRAELSGIVGSSRIRELASRELGMIFPAEPPRNLYLGHTSLVVSGLKEQDAD